MLTGTIVVADDEAPQRETLAKVLRRSGHVALAVAGGREAIEAVRVHPVDVVLTDLRMPDLTGMEVLSRVKELQPDVAVVVITAFGSVASAVEAMKAGAADYLSKPVDLDELDLVVARLLEKRDLVRENRALRSRLAESSAGASLVGGSQALLSVLEKGARAAATDVTMLLRGESGTGKELLARTLHDVSPRSRGPFVPVHCAALPETLLESELFGHEKGAFTGADSRHRGRVEQARGGTVFLDEIGDVAPVIQAKLLRFLQDLEYTRLGGEETLHADVRVIAATHRDLEDMVRQGSFREDLYYRLNVVSLELPPLRARRADVPRLVEHFIAHFAKRHDRPTVTISREALDVLTKYAFPGNVRELQNIIEQAIVLARGDIIAVNDLPPRLHNSAADSCRDFAIDPNDIRGNLPELLEVIEHRVVLEALARFAGNQSSAARHLGLTESGLRYKLKKWQGDL